MEDRKEDNEIRITSAGKERHYIGYAMGLLLEKGQSTVVLTAMGSAINKCITVAEILKRRVAGLHQWNQIQSVLLEIELMKTEVIKYQTLAGSIKSFEERKDTKGKDKFD